MGGEMTSLRFQHQGPDDNCVINGHLLGWVSCTAYAMAMLVHAATDGEQSPKGCALRRRTKGDNGKVDDEGGLSLSQVERVAEQFYGVPINRRTGGGAIPITKAIARLENGQGFVLQGNNDGWGMAAVDHAIYVDRVRGGTTGAPKQALVLDSQRKHAVWVPWEKVVGFGSHLRTDGSGGRPKPGTFWAGFGPARATPEEQMTASVAADNGVKLRFGAKALAGRMRMRATVPHGHAVKVRRTPRDLAVRLRDTLDDGEVFVTWQRLEDGERPAPGATRRWYGNKDGTSWVHASGLRRIPGPAVPGGLVADDPAFEEDPGQPTDVDDDGSMVSIDDQSDDVANGDLRASQADPDAKQEASDPFPDDVDGEFKGPEITDAEIDDLPVLAF
jgi:hypothetical protein